MAMLETDCIKKLQFPIIKKNGWNNREKYDAILYPPPPLFLKLHPCNWRNDI